MISMFVGSLKTLKYDKDEPLILNLANFFDESTITRIYASKNVVRRWVAKISPARRRSRASFDYFEIWIVKLQWQ